MKTSRWLGEAVLLTKRITPTSGPAIGGEIHVYVGLTVKVIGDDPEVMPRLDLMCFDEHGGSFTEKSVRFSPAEPGSPEAVGCWARRL